MFCVCQLHAEEIVYKTSFEEFKTAKLQEVELKGVTWVANSSASITEKFANTGQKSLHISGGESNAVELKLKGELSNSRGLSFAAERWTRKGPFEFRVDLLIDGSWKHLINLDTVIQTGPRFLSKISLELPDKQISAIKFTCTAPEKSGILIDDLMLQQNIPLEKTVIPEVAAENIRALKYDKALFVSGTENTKTFRIPAIITALNGDLIAACDARRRSGADLIGSNDIDIVIKRSSDQGKTWSVMETVCDLGEGYPASDPSFILENSTGEIFCFYNYMDQKKAKRIFRLWYQSSKDHGKSWSKPRDITDDVTPSSWNKDFKFITSGRGIQARSGELLHTIVNLKRGLFLFGSKDYGKSWYLKDTAIKPGDESKVLELNDGLMINSRVNGSGFRWVHVSLDEGKTWKSHKELQLVDPSCNGSIIRYTSKKDGYSKNRLVFCNANSFKGRKNLSVRLSYDEGKTWTKGKVIYSGASAYSSLTVCKDGSIGVLYEANNYKEIRFAKLTLENLTDGKDSLSIPFKL